MNMVATLLADATVAHKTGLLDQAAAMYRKVLDREPRNPDALHLLGVVAQQQGDSERAERLIRAAIAEVPHSAIFHDHLGNVMGARGDWAAAAERSEERRVGKE